jgi:hypothetical protein
MPAGARDLFSVDARPWLPDGWTLVGFEPEPTDGLTIETATIFAGLDVQFWMSADAGLPRGRLFSVAVRVQDNQGAVDYQAMQIQLI